MQESIILNNILDDKTSRKMKFETYEEALAYHIYLAIDPEFELIRTVTNNIKIVDAHKAEVTLSDVPIIPNYKAYFFF